MQHFPVRATRISTVEKPADLAWPKISKEKMKPQTSEIGIPPPTMLQIEKAVRVLETMGYTQGETEPKVYKAALLQVTSDLATIEKLDEVGVKQEQSHVISHAASFSRLHHAESFSRLVHLSGYVVEAIERTLTENVFKVLFQHSGTFAFDDILTHTMSLDRAATKFKGYYDGWEIVIELRG